jgi:predicted Zn finger-like uncharacterized protein
VKVEIRCPACGRGYLIDPAKAPSAGGKVACKACGAGIELPRRAAAPTARPSSVSRASPKPPPAPPSAPRPAVGAASAGPAPSEGLVICPRCGLHFSPAKTAPTARGSSRSTVLVVEDMEYFLEIAKEALSPKYEVKTATSLAEARRALSAGGIDLILLDLTLEGGEEGLTLIREMPFKPCPVVIFTAEDESEMYGESWAKLQSAGVDDLVIKGINVGESLARKVGALLGDAEPEAPTGR